VIEIEKTLVIKCGDHYTEKGRTKQNRRNNAVLFCVASFYFNFDRRRNAGTGVKLQQEAFGVFKKTGTGAGY
jgi:hypothetical protein